MGDWVFYFKYAAFYWYRHFCENVLIDFFTVLNDPLGRNFVSLVLFNIGLGNDTHVLSLNLVTNGPHVDRSMLSFLATDNFVDICTYQANSFESNGHFQMEFRNWRVNSDEKLSLISPEPQSWHQYWDVYCNHIWNTKHLFINEKYHLKVWMKQFFNNQPTE